jgi:hypothetical protein
MSTQTTKTMSTTLANESETPNCTHTDSNVTNATISEQFEKLKQLFLIDDTVKTFEKSLRLLFILIRESITLIWLVFCWGIVALNWVGVHARQVSQGFKSWLKAFHAVDEHKSKKDIAAEIARNAMQNLVVKAKKQIGLQDNL